MLIGDLLKEEPLFLSTEDVSYNFYFSYYATYLLFDGP